MIESPTFLNSSSFWTLSKEGNKIIRDPQQENLEKGFNWEKFCDPSNGFDDLNYMWWEINDCYIFESNGCDYERMGCTIGQGDVVVDIGANIGMFARRASSRGASKIFCFEPGSKQFSCLLDNVDPKAECFKLAIGFQPGVIDLDFSAGSCLGGGSITGHLQSVRSETAIVMSLDYLFSIGLFPDHIDFLKIDCEGAEDLVFKGCSDDNLKRIQKIAMEFHPMYLPEDVRESIVHRLSGLGFSHFTLFHGSGNEVTLNFWR